MTASDQPNTAITSTLVPEDQRMDITAALFSNHFPLQVEPFVYSITDNIAHEYNGGYWDFFTLSNGGFFMAPHADHQFNVSCENGFRGQMSADALGITSCLYAYSNLSFSDNAGLSEVCTQHFHLLREYALDHPEAGNIFRAVD